MDGILLVDKPGGMTSHDVVGACRRFFSRKDIGHAGTLDPMATGLLVLLVGKATKISDFVLNGDKAYETTVLLGVETDTDDITGTITNQLDSVSVTVEQVKEAVSQLTGLLQLPVPIYSAIKVKGKKLYEKARKGEDFTPPVKDMDFQDLELLSFQDNRVKIKFSCSKGSYVRAWGKALGNELGCGATLENLRRTHSQPYTIDQAIPLSMLQESPPETLYTHPAFIPLSQTLPTWPRVKVEGMDEKLLRNGQISRKLERFLELEYGGMNLQGIKVISKKSNNLVGLLSHTPPLNFKIRRIFPS